MPQSKTLIESATAPVEPLGGQKCGFIGQCVNVSDGFSLKGERRELNHHGMSMVLIQSSPEV